MTNSTELCDLTVPTPFTSSGKASASSRLTTNVTKGGNLEPGERCGYLTDENHEREKVDVQITPERSVLK